MDAWGEGCEEEEHLWAPESRWGLFGFARGVEAVLGGVDSPMGEELGVGGVQVRVPSRRRIALTSGRCHQTRAGGRGAPSFGANLECCARVSNSLSYPPIVAQIAGHLGGIDGSHHADRDGDTACVPRTRIVDVAGRPRRSVITAPATPAHRATQTRDARLAKWHRPRPSTVQGCGARAPGLELDRTHARARGERALAPGVARVDPGEFCIGSQHGHL